MNDATKQATLLREAAARADAWLKERGFECEQRNGQRLTINKNLETLPKDVKENEVFIGKLPRNMFEDELLPFLEMAGQVYKIRLMMDFGMTNRGYAFARYTTIPQAINAWKTLNGTKIRPNELPVGVLESFDNKRLFFGNLPDMSEAELFKRLSEKINNIDKVKLHCKPSGSSDRRYAFVIFKSHNDATAARRLLLPGTMKICGRDITVDWAKAELPSANGSNMNTHNNPNRPLANKNFNNSKNITNNNADNNHYGNKQAFNRNNPTPMGSRASSTNSTLSASIFCQNQPISQSTNFKEEWNLLDNQSSTTNNQQPIDPIGYFAKSRNFNSHNNGSNGPSSNVIYLNHFKNNILASSQQLNDKNIMGSNFSSYGMDDFDVEMDLPANHSTSSELGMNFDSGVFTPNEGLSTDSVDGGDSVLGHKTKQMLQMVSDEPPIHYNLFDTNNNHRFSQRRAKELDDNSRLIHTGFHTIYSGENIVVLDNINVNKAPIDKLKDMFELNKRIKINSIYRSGSTSMTIIYERPEDAELLVEAITYLPCSFAGLSVNQELLQARRMVA